MNEKSPILTEDHQALLNYVPADNVLKDRVILVTGAGSGIGRAISLAYARFGATVVLLGKTLKELEVVYDEIEDAGYPEPAIYPLNMEGATVKDYQDMAATFEDKLGGLDGIALNAGWLPAFIPFKEYDLELWSKTMMVNLHANFLITQACLPLLEASKDAAIVFSAHDSHKAYNGAFGVAKAGSQAMMDILADEYDVADNFIRVNSIDTGPVDTQMRRMNFPGEDMSVVAKPESLVGPYLYFMGPDAAQRTGEKVIFERLSADTKWPGE
ncbi:MAG: 3-oxoacyl-ACP reductase [Thiotrichales bacterium]|nr:MAG: 3-oxoacyl-ACP reductase [Thiotrichales bacterium]